MDFDWLGSPAMVCRCIVYIHSFLAVRANFLCSPRTVIHGNILFFLRNLLHFYRHQYFNWSGTTTKEAFSELANMKTTFDKNTRKQAMSVLERKKTLFKFDQMLGCWRHPQLLDLHNHRLESFWIEHLKAVCQFFKQIIGQENREGVDWHTIAMVANKIFI